ncbi:hypothetical protein LOTGIDRAFT_171147 [Lottia gigantea]|uniref:Chitin-binding type-2 domain-containing protein n=1 Tax=Lottia gigantea TaxID=225164 RepID=V4B7W8_LOTGI|nr:hypothetical protein LOTGIDRAFT_171147 [Lottia gigantea]ESP03721.1 hypothetical protein LOTGIDRAFT_171147 [Lottia gigantea]
MKLLVVLMLNVVVYISAQCLTGEIRADPTDCTGYLHCAFPGLLIPRRCPTGTGFNGFRCDHLQHIPGCVQGPDACTGNGYDIFLDPTDCTRYLQCIRGRFTSKPCPANTGFDVRFSRCNHLSDIPNCP